MRIRPEEARSGGVVVWRSLVTCGLAAMLLGGCASRPSYPIEDSPQFSEGRDGDGRDREDSEDQERLRYSTERNNDWSDAFTAPLEDFNLRRQDIPVILSLAVTKPYDLTGLDTCDAIAAQVIELDSLLGLDFDEPPPPAEERSMREKGKDFANDQAVGAVRGATRSIIPFRGAIRYLSGADKHQKQLDNAIQAGKVRRAYLKGIGMNKNCAPPAAPSWFRPRAYVETPVQPAAAAVAATPPAPKQRTAQKRR